MTYARTNAGSFVRGYNTTITPALTGYVVGQLLLAATGCVMNTGAAPASTIGNWTRVSSVTNATHVCLYATIAQTTSDAMPGFAWSDFCWAKAWAVSGNPGTLTGIVESSRDGAANSTINAGSTSSTGSFTPSGSGRYVVHIANKNKTSASNSTVFSAASGFSIIDQSVGSNTAPAAIISEWIQGAATLVDTSSCAGTVADGSVQATQGIKISFIPGSSIFVPPPIVPIETLNYTRYYPDY